MTVERVKPFPWRCGECREREVVPVVVRLYETEAYHDGATYRLSLADYRLYRCSRCGSAVVGDEGLERVSEALREAAGILPPEAIRTIRESLGLSQAGLAGRLGVPVAAVQLWERGCMLQDREMDAKIRDLFKAGLYGA